MQIYAFAIHLLVDAASLRGAAAWLVKLVPDQDIIWT